MSNQSVEHTVCCYVLKGTRLIFADERIKFHLLRKIESIQKIQKWKIYAFCLTDDTAYFITEAENTALVQAELGHAVHQILHQLATNLWDQEVLSHCFSQAVPRILHSMDEVAVCCRKLHLLPLIKGYVYNENDYWWSSYNTYTGFYNWDFLNTDIMLQHFSENQEEAVCRFRTFHRIFRKSLKLPFDENNEHCLEI